MGGTTRRYAMISKKCQNTYAPLPSEICCHGDNNNNSKINSLFVLPIIGLAIPIGGMSIPLSEIISR